MDSLTYGLLAAGLTSLCIGLIRMVGPKDYAFALAAIVILLLGMMLGFGFGDGE